MRSLTLKGRWLIAPTLLVAFCSTGPSPSPTSLSTASAPGVTGFDKPVGGSAAGDVKIGAGVLEIMRLRMDRQTAAGASILRQYALPGGVYRMNAGESIELWAEYDPAGLPRNPRLIVNWGVGEADSTGCGACKLTHRYNTPGLYTVAASLDDMSGTMVTRTFFLDSRLPAETPTPTATPATPWIASFTGGGQTIYKFPSRPLPPSPDRLESWYQQICEDAGLRPVSCDSSNYSPPYDASAWNAVPLGTSYWGCNVSNGVEGRTGWANVITFHAPVWDTRGICETGCGLSGNDVFPICTDPPEVE